MNIDKSKLMKMAWKTSKVAAEKFNAPVKSFFSESLKQTWKTLNNENLVTGLCKIGNEWTKGDHHRVYFNYLTEFVNIDELSWEHEKELRTNTAHYRVNEKCWYSGIETPELWNKLQTAIENKAKKIKAPAQNDVVYNGTGIINDDDDFTFY